MAQLAGADEIESMRTELAEIGRSIRSSFRRHVSSFQNGSSMAPEPDSDADENDDEYELQWAAVQRLPTFERITKALFDELQDGSAEHGNVKGKRVVDLKRIGADERHLLIEKLIKHVEHDNLRLLQKLRKRIDK